MASARAARHLTQRELALQVGTDQAQLSRLELGQRGTTTLLLLAALADALGLTPGELLEQCLERRRSHGE